MKTLRMIVTFPFVVVLACILLVFTSIKSLADDLESVTYAVANWLIDWVHQTKVAPDKELVVGEAIFAAHDSYIKTELGNLSRAITDNDDDFKKWIGRAAIKAAKELP